MKLFSKGLLSLLIFPPFLVAEPCDLLKSESKSEQATTDLITTIVDAVPIKRVPPKYPTKEAKLGNEGWTQLSFVVGKDGKTSDVEVINSSGSRWFDKQAISSIKRWSYEPATANGEVIEQCRTTVQLDFRMGGKPQLPRKKLKKLQRVVRLANAKNWEELKPYIVEFTDEPFGSFIEQSYMNYIAAEYYRVMGNVDAQFHHLLKAVPHNYSPGKYFRLPEVQVIHGLQQLFVIRVKRQLYFDAMQTFEQLEKLEHDNAKHIVSKFQRYYDLVKTTVLGEQLITVDGSIRFDNWSHNLVRNAFSIQDIQGEIEQLDVRCENKRYIYKVEEESVWKIPSSWGNCQVLISGKPKTSFKLLEVNGDSV